MQLHEFIFSNEPRKRRLRHIVFWTAWWIYFYGSIYILHSSETKSGLWRAATYKWSAGNLIMSLFNLSLHIGACYIVLYFLLPWYLLKSKYFKFSIAILLLGVAMAYISHFINQIIFPNSENQFIPFGNRHYNTWWTSVFAGPINAIKIIAVAVIIKLLKRWWLKQKESLQLEREKINAELQLLKAQIHPGFLFNTLNNIYVYSLAGSPRASEMLLKLSDLISYMLYECDGPLVPLEKEIEMMKEYMALEKIRQGETLEMEIKIKGDLTHKLIAPFLLLPFIENGFKQCNHINEKSWVNLEIKVKETYCIVKLINGIPPEMINQPDIYGNGLINVQKRLNLLYPGKHELTMTVEEEVFLVNLKIQLDEQEDKSIAMEASDDIVETQTV